MARFHVAIIRPEGYLHSSCFREVAETLHVALTKLGHTVVTAENSIDAHATSIVLGAHLLTEQEAATLLPSCIVYNLEQLGATTLPGWYMALASRLRIWDYSRLNLARWNTVPCLSPAKLVEIGYVPELSRINSATAQDIDVLFYGSMNERRVAVLQALERTGVRMHAAFGIYGDERDALIARAKVVLNLHAYGTEVFEIVRVSYLLANAKAVVTEAAPDLGDLAEAVVSCPYDQLVPQCLALLDDEPARRKLEQRGAAIFAQRQQVEILRRALADTQKSVASPAASVASAYPRILNLGSGKDWREDCLNIDINDYWKPDAVLDISQPLPGVIELLTERFGTIRIEPGYFDLILANDVLEHIPNLTQAMGAALQLLRSGGLFNIQVPYDLSWGGWQDPTHIRAFNERSWLYYTDWFWYLGWTEARFTLENIEFVLSPIGEQLKSRLAGDELLRTPRAVDSMRVCLRKRLLDQSEKAYAANYLKRPERATEPASSKSTVQASRPSEAAVLPDDASQSGTSGASRAAPEIRVTRLKVDREQEVTGGYYDGLNEKLYAAIPTAHRVLEFGCARGRLGERYKQAHPDAFWAGVDISAQALAAAAQRLDATYQLNVDDGLVDDFGEKFDCVVFGDLIEHLQHPAEFLTKLRDLTTQDATLICCVPSMGHISVIERMLMGDISYDPEGLLDATHLRFFSHRSLFKLLLDAGWLPNLQDAFVADHTDPRLANQLIEAAALLGVPQATAVTHLFTYQMIVRGSKGAEPPQEAHITKGGLFSVIVPVTNEAQLKLNILRSPGLAEVNAEIILVRHAASAAAAFAAGAKRASSPWRLFCHQDVYFPHGTGRTIERLLEAVPETDIKSQVIGFAGLGLDGVSKAGLVVDRANLFDFPGTCHAISIDEFCVVLHRDVEYSIDATLGWHLWGTDLCLQAMHRKMGPRYAGIVRVPLFHNSTNDGDLTASYHRSETRMLAKYPRLPKIASLNSTFMQPQAPPLP